MGTASEYEAQLNELLDEFYNLHENEISYIMGIVTALRDDIKAGYISSLIELVH